MVRKRAAFMRSREETLRWLYREAEQALGECTPDRKSALISQLRGIAAELEEVCGEQKETSGLTPLEEILAARAKRAG